MQPYPCESVEEVARPRGDVPHHLPGDNPYLTEFAERHHIPYAATRGGAATAYPEGLADSSRGRSRIVTDDLPLSGKVLTRS